MQPDELARSYDSIAHRWLEPHLEANGIRPVLDQHFPLENLADAFRHQAANAHFGKIIVDI